MRQQPIPEIEMNANSSAWKKCTQAAIFFITVFSAAVLTGCAGTGPTASADRGQQGYELKDGSTLVVDANGQMRMFRPDGSKLHMAEGVKMELKDGRVIVMHENVVWRELREHGTMSPRSP
jgi:hypothetical protein